MGFSGRCASSPGICEISLSSVSSYFISVTCYLQLLVAFALNTAGVAGCRPFAGMIAALLDGCTGGLHRDALTDRKRRRALQERVGEEARRNVYH
jgi:hypothetical protein